MKIFVGKNAKNEFTRMCIAEAIIDLLGTKSLHEIHVSSVVLRAGVSRMTFYNNYKTITDALADYLQILVEKYTKECNANPEIGPFLTYSHILFSINFFDEYRRYFQVMAANGLHNIMLDAVNNLLTENAAATSYSTFELYCYSGGLLNAFLKWIENKESGNAEDIAALIYNLYNRTPKQSE